MTSLPSNRPPDPGRVAVTVMIAAGDPVDETEVGRGDVGDADGAQDDERDQPDPDAAAHATHLPAAPHARSPEYGVGPRTSPRTGPSTRRSGRPASRRADRRAGRRGRATRVERSGRPTLSLLTGCLHCRLRSLSRLTASAAPSRRRRWSGCRCAGSGRPGRAPRPGRAARCRAARSRCRGCAKSISTRAIVSA